MFPFTLCGGKQFGLAEIVSWQCILVDRRLAFASTSSVAIHPIATLTYLLSQDANLHDCPFRDRKLQPNRTSVAVKIEMRSTKVLVSNPSFGEYRSPKQHRQYHTYHPASNLLAHSGLCLRMFEPFRVLTGLHVPLSPGYVRRF